MALQKGDKAPSFKLYNTNKQEVSLEDFEGKNLIIHFFPAAFTGVCTAQLCTMRDNIEYYTRLNADVVGISVDMLFSLGKFKDEQNYTFDLLSDFNKQTIRDYGVYFENFAFGMKGVASRAAFVIDKDGVIQYAEVLDSPANLPDFQAIKSTLESL
ncbi:redoxin domain-containing protein [Runella sp. MFBS21]|uniref:redoxin domain-containing protein n=1 Tax=Runella sp. MFBS21 TaxID=3034018 RepID=UPI0023F6562D|nr:redoxin domain-containing protein [Runella sp. MFBS21]MDF7817528.1 redoxin domain-containing protein [Runella sp. MFBS21]